MTSKRQKQTRERKRDAKHEVLGKAPRSKQSTPSRCSSATEGEGSIQKEDEIESVGPTSDYLGPEQSDALNKVTRRMLEVGISLITPSCYELAHAATR